MQLFTFYNKKPPKTTVFPAASCLAKQRHGFCRAKSPHWQHRKTSWTGRSTCFSFDGDAGFALQRLLPKVNRVQPKGFTLQSNGTAFAVQNPRFGIKKRNSLRCSFFVFNIRKSYTKDIAIMLCFYKKRMKNQEYYPGLFSYYIRTEYPTEQVI